jgi:hypothetical protein
LRIGLISRDMSLQEMYPMVVFATDGARSFSRDLVFR